MRHHHFGEGDYERSGEVIRSLLQEGARTCAKNRHAGGLAAFGVIEM